MLSTPLICCSIGVATDWARVFASAPTKVVWMRISGGTMLGNWAMGNWSMETAPTSTIRMAITIATMGRLMKKRYMAVGPAVSGGFYLLPGWFEARLLVGA